MVSAYEEGKTAYKKGLNENDNPYEMYPYMNQWSSGWHQQRMETAISRRFIYR
jgi:hypothetical protein